MQACNYCKLKNGFTKDYVICNTCPFEDEDDQVLHCPKFYTDFYIVSVTIGNINQDILRDLIYTHCKEQL